MKGYKKILIQLFFLLFVTETFGIYKFVHFCGSEKTSESFFISKNDCCCGDDEDEMDGCCTDETAIIQLKEDNTLVTKDFVKSPENTSFDLFYETSTSEQFTAKSLEKAASEIIESESSGSHTPLIIKYRSLLI